MPAVIGFFFRILERLGVHLTPNHYHFPIPDTGRLPEALWSRQSGLPGLDMNVEGQLVLLDLLAERYGSEMAGLPRTAREAKSGFYLENRHFETVDAEIYYGLIRDRAPRRILEVGSGFSTRLALIALEKNRLDGRPGSITLCDPEPPSWAKAGEGALERVITARVQDLPLETFTRLTASDMLFIDSSHVLAIGSDVQFLFLEVLPRLTPGVLVHVHDIFLPAEYPKYWVRDRLRFWNEQYLLQAFLALNDRFRVTWASHWMALRHPERLARAIPSFGPGRSPGSFWMERVS
ncbi:MAG TPA: class I SAM-dependent methyltransferase [Candidatus Eisenbacteria bacterium]|nr:class I SAM-dependent methyltransferase [Candidatus Eisenbacteria bacterium]